MYMNCRKCKGRMFVDRIFSEKAHIEIFCVMCGVRKMLDKEKSVFAAWLMKRETEHSLAVSVSAP